MTASQNIIALQASDTRITSVALYPDCAEVTRAAWVSFEKGTNKLTISGLPTKIDRDSIRVTGSGQSDTIIGRVTISDIPTPVGANTWALERKKSTAQTSLRRVQESLTALQSYLSTLSSERTSPDDVVKMMEAYEKNSKRLDDKASELGDEILRIDEEIQKARPDWSSWSARRTAVSVEILADKEGEADINLSYFIRDCKWEPTYDIRASIKDDTAEVELVYKATITQSTDEDWSKTNLKLETLSPTLESQSLTLQPWKISLQERRPVPIHSHGHWYGQQCRSGPPPPGAIVAEPMRLARSRAAPAAFVPPVPSSPGDLMSLEEPEDLQTMMSTVNVNDSSAIAHATFQIPGEVTIPGNGEAHSFVITNVKLSGKVAWVTMPKVDPRVLIKGQFTNTSDVPLLKGKANIYLDGAFMKRTELDSISPGEKFSLALGHDPSIRILYPRRHQLSSRSGYTFREILSDTFEQKILISNGKKVPIDLKVIDQIPVSENSLLDVKLISPGLVVPTPAPTSTQKKIGGGGVHTLSSSSGSGSGSGSTTPSSGTQGQKGSEGQEKSETEKTASFIKKGVTANWDTDGSSGGRKEGMIAWKCHLEPQGSTELMLKWSVECSDKKYLITGL